MPSSQQKIISLDITKLKNIKNCKIDFSGKPLTAIMGVNGIGKSTILHALACCYKPTDVERKDYKFPDFFPPNTYALWNDSCFKLSFSYRDGARESGVIEREYIKRDRWSPRYRRRPDRYVSFTGIDSCVPEIELNKNNTFQSLTLSEQTGDISQKVLKGCKFVLDIQYERLAICVGRQNKTYLGVLRQDIGGYCTALSMGAGEQRVFKILNEVYSCPKHSLILIDEVDLLLHENALKRMIQKLFEIATNRNLQIVFTTHSMLMTELTQYVDIRYLVQTPEMTLVQTSISTDSIWQLTGTQNRPISIYVEDLLSQTIISKITRDQECVRNVEIYRFGPAINAFTVIAGKALNGTLNAKTIAVLDGDVYKTEEEKTRRIQEVLTGQTYQPQREQVLRAILQYDLPTDIKPESYIRNAILALPEEILPANAEARQVLRDIGVPDDEHGYINIAIERMGFTYETGLSEIINLFAKSDQWNNFTLPIRQWLQLANNT